MAERKVLRVPGAATNLSEYDVMSQQNILTEDQRSANRLLAGPQRWTCLVGGSRSGKTFLSVRGIVARCLDAPKSRHLIIRWHAVDAWTSIALDTLPKVMQICYPGIEYHFNGSLKYCEFEDGQQIWIGGLADKEQADKVLGREYATIFANECSQISYGSMVLVRTRLAQVVNRKDGRKLPQRGWHDLNPVGKGHWTNLEFGELRSPVDRKPLPDPDNYKRQFLNPEGNKKNLDPLYLLSLQNLPTRQRARFYEGRYVDETSSALWTFAILERCRVLETARRPDLVRVVVAVDPSGAKNELDKGHDAIGIVVVGRGTDGHAYVLADRTLLGGPKQWARAAVSAYHFFKADAIVAEINFGGAMVENTIMAEDKTVKVITVTASRGKVQRAEPCSALYGDPQNPDDMNHPPKVHHVGRFPELEDELTNFSDMGYTGDDSPNRADALIWGLTELMLGESVDGWVQYYKDVTAHGRGEPTTAEAELIAVGGDAPVQMLGTPHNVYSPEGGVRYTADEEGVIFNVAPEHIKAMKNSGCHLVKP